MTIVLTVPDIKIGGGISKYVYILANSLQASGNAVHVVTTHSSHEDNCSAVYNFNDGVYVHSTFSQNIVLRYVRTLLLIWKLNPDIIINNYNGVVQYLLPLLSIQKSKIIHVIHGIVDDFYRIATINAKYVSAWIVPSEAVEAQFNNYSFYRYKERVFVIPHGVPATSFELNKTSQVPELTFIGVLYEHKGAHMLPDIVKGIAESGLPFHFNIVGDGVLRESLEASLFSEIERGLVHFTGVVPTSKVNEILSRTSVFVYPTQLDSFGLVIAEAMMSGAVPVVSHLLGVTDNLVSDGENGYLVPVGDVNSMVKQIMLLLGNRETLELMKCKSMETARSKFSVGRMTEHYLRMIDSLSNR